MVWFIGIIGGLLVVLVYQTLAKVALRDELAGLRAAEGRRGCRCHEDATGERG